jgi:hypothetical protein
MTGRAAILAASNRSLRRRDGLVTVRAFDSRVGTHFGVPLRGCEEGALSLRNLSAIARPSVLVSAMSTTIFPDFFRRRPIFAIFAVRRPICTMAKCLGQNCALTCEDCEQCVRRTDEREKYVVYSSFLSTIPRSNLRRTVRRLCEDLRTLCKHVQLDGPRLKQTSRAL